MLEILNNIFKSMLQDGYQVHAVYGERWLLSAKSDIDRLTFLILPQNGTFSLADNEKKQNLTWFVVYPSIQNNIDENDTIITEEQIWDINKKFLARLIAYTTSTGLQPFSNFGELNFKAFHDEILTQVPCSGFAFSLQFNQIETTFCE